MTKKVFLAHNACLNAGYDLNVLRAGIQSASGTIVDRPEDADEIVFSGCSVREHWVDDAIDQVGEAISRAPHARVVVTGCVANTSSEKVRNSLGYERLEILPIADVLKESTNLPFEEVDRRNSQGAGHGFESTTFEGLYNLRNRVGPAKSTVVAELEEEDRRHGTELVRAYQQTTKGFVFYDEHDPCEMITVTRSCLYQCSFCSIPQGRGEYTSVPLADVLDKAKAAVGRGITHLVLIGDEVGNYGVRSGGARFADMVKAVLDISPAVKLSIRYIEPKPFLKNFEDILAWGQSGRLQLLYISLQSGSSRVLKAMRRGYDIQKVAQALQQFRSSAPSVLYGNWLVGFPGESEDDFERTVDLVRRLDFHINVAIPFSARPETPANTMEHQVDAAVVASRVERLTDLAAELKAGMMRPLLGTLDQTRRDELLSLIRRAERDQYSPPTLGKGRPIPLTVQMI
ncbi:radical SAM protein [Luteimonas sp. RC10]|uniref:radical SAM protein n=1 Tax=Luteimonas sp. RC10 TaxID=2587035 RepID=UPI00161962E8|nr:radical SAM protein [Luteimonas sp. RC10]MBB3342453.1 tRNA A37 methylthiotransferase MiaB [Luteimonas sp. RC10]